MNYEIEKLIGLYKALVGRKGVINYYSKRLMHQYSKALKMHYKNIYTNKAGFLFIKSNNEEGQNEVFFFATNNSERQEVVDKLSEIISSFTSIQDQIINNNNANEESDFEFNEIPSTSILYAITELYKFLDEEEKNQLRLSLENMDIIDNRETLSDIEIRNDIEKGFIISLPDYGILEVNLYPRLKPLYFLYLMKTEGLRYDELKQFLEVLTELYIKVKKTTERADAKIKMEELVGIGVSPDKADKKVTQAVSSIKKTFKGESENFKCEYLKKLPERIVRNYYIDGDRSYRRSICIDRNKVDMLEISRMFPLFPLFFLKT